MWITDFRVRLEISGVDAFYELLSHLDDLLTACVARGVVASRRCRGRRRVVAADVDGRWRGR